MGDQKENRLGREGKIQKKMKQTNIVWIWIFSICAIVKLTEGNQLNNDTCASVKMNSISSITAQIECYKDAKTFDPTYQSGWYLFDKITGSWNQSGIFSCLCNCHLTKIKNGHILPETIGHGETFEYKCYEGFYKTIKSKIICFDGVLMLVPDNLKDYNISIAFRQKALPGWFIKYQGMIFPLNVSETSRWTIPETEVGNNQKYFKSLSEDETKLELYLFNGVGYTIGIVDLKTGLEPTCIRTEAVPSAGAIAAGIIVPVLVVLIVIIVVIVCFHKFKRCSRPTTEPNDTSDDELT